MKKIYIFSQPANVRAGFYTPREVDRSEEKILCSQVELNPGHMDESPTP